MPILSVGRTSNQHGVTLIEMMVVVTIIALMAGISFPAVSAGIDSVRLRLGHRFAGQLSQRRGQPRRAAAAGRRGGDFSARQRPHLVFDRARLHARIEDAGRHLDRRGTADRTPKRKAHAA